MTHETRTEGDYQIVVSDDAGAMFQLKVMHMRLGIASRIISLGQFMENKDAFAAGHRFIVRENARLRL